MLRVLAIASSATCSELTKYLARQEGTVLVDCADTLPRAITALARDHHDTVIIESSAAFPEAGWSLLPRLRPRVRLALITPPGIHLEFSPGVSVPVLLPPITQSSLTRVLASWRQSAGSGGPLLLVQSRERAHLVPLNWLHTIVARENYTEQALADGTRCFVRCTMQQWVSRLPPEQFVRIHRSLVINLGAIAQIERGPNQCATVHFGGERPFSMIVKRRYAPSLRARWAQWMRETAPSLLPAPDPRAVAVLPFDHAQSTDENAIFCDGLTDEIINRLARVPGLRVAARTSVFFFKGKKLPAPTVARQLGVSYLLEGSVRRTGGQARITVQLVDARGLQVWADHFEGDFTDCTATQEAITARVAQQLQLNHTSADPTASPRPNTETRWLVMAGRHFWNLRTAEGFSRAEQSFTRALALDAGFAPAHAGLADVHIVRAMYRLADGIPLPAVAPEINRARDAARQAVALDPSLAEPHATLGFVAFHEGRLDDAAVAFQRAIALNPSYPTGRQFYAWTLCAQGRLAEALSEYDHAVALDPLSFINIDRHAAMLALAQKFPEALAANTYAASLRADVFVGNLSQRAPILLALGQTAEAVNLARAVRLTDPTSPFRRNSDADALHVLHQTGHVTEAADYAHEVLARLGPRNYLRGFVLSAIGRQEEALADLAHTPTIMLPQLYWSPIWAEVRTKPLMRHLFAQLGRTDEARTAHEPGLLPRPLSLAPFAF